MPKRKRGRPRKEPEVPQEKPGYAFELDFPFELLQLCSEIQHEEHKAFKVTVGAKKCEDVSLRVDRDESRLKISLQGSEMFPLEVIENKWQCTISSVHQEHDGKGDAPEDIKTPDSVERQAKRQKPTRQSFEAGDNKAKTSTVESPAKESKIEDTDQCKDESRVSTTTTTEECPEDVKTPLTSTRKSGRISTAAQVKPKSNTRKSACKIIVSPVELNVTANDEVAKPESTTQGSEDLLPQNPQVELMPELSEDLKELIKEVVTDFEQEQGTTISTEEVVAPEVDLEQLIIAEDNAKVGTADVKQSSRSRSIRTPKRFDGDIILTKKTRKKRTETEPDKRESKENIVETPVKVKEETLVPDETDSFSCDHCAAKLASLLELVKHKAIVHGIRKRGRKPKALKLLEEEELMKNDPEYATREKTPPKKKDPMHCPANQCDLSYTDKKSLLNHVRETHKDEPDYNETVQKADALIHKVYFEGKVKGEETVYMTCEICDVVRIGSSIFQHLKFCHENAENYQDILNNVNEQYEEERKKARKLIKKRYEDKVKTKGLVYMCQYCGKQFEFRPTRTNHEKFRCKHNPQRLQLLECYVCGFATPKNDKFEEHMKKHEGFQFLQCNICDKKYKTRAGLIVHNRKVHNIIKRRPIIKYPCDICGREFYDKDHLRIHVAIHSDARSYQCELCGSQYKTAAQVQKHQKMVHFNRYAFHCEKCGHGVEKRAYLENHKCGRVRRVQAQEKTFVDHTRPKAKKERGSMQKIAKKPEVEYIQIVQPRKGNEAPTYITSIVKQDPGEEQPMHMMLEFQSDGHPQTMEGSSLQLGEYVTSEQYPEGSVAIQSFPETTGESGTPPIMGTPQMVTADGKTILKVIQPEGGAYGHLVPVNSEMMEIGGKELSEEIYQTTTDGHGIQLVKEEETGDGSVIIAVEDPNSEIQMGESGEVTGSDRTEQIYVQGGIESDMKILEMEGQEIEMHEAPSEVSDLASASMSITASEQGTEATGEAAVDSIPGEMVSSAELSAMIEVPANVAVAGFSAEEHMVWEQGSIDQSERGVAVSQITLEELQKLGFSLTSVPQQETTYVYAPTSSETTVISDTIEATEEVVVASDSDYFVVKGQEAENS